MSSITITSPELRGGFITPEDVLAGRQAERNEGTKAENNLKG
jgi:hypothetical protein